MTTHAEAARVQLNTILDQEINATNRLADILNTENAAISQRDLKTLEQVIAEKQQGLQLLEDLNRDRARLIESYGGNPDREGMLICTRDWDDSGGLGRKWQALLALADSCRRQNRINHQLVELGSRHAHTALCILRGDEPDQALYGPHGDNVARHSSRDLGTV